MASAALRVWKKVGVAFFDREFVQILECDGLEAGIAHLIQKHDLDGEEAARLRRNLDGIQPPSPTTS